MDTKPTRTPSGSGLASIAIPTRHNNNDQTFGPPTGTISARTRRRAAKQAMRKLNKARKAGRK